MNNNNFKSVHLKSANGTDLNIELPEGHIWAGGSEGDVNGIPLMQIYLLKKYLLFQKNRC